MNRTEEVAAKREALRAVLADLGLDGAVLSTPAMFSWYTAGGENRVALSPRTGTASIVATAEKAIAGRNQSAGSTLSISHWCSASDTTPNTAATTAA